MATTPTPFTPPKPKVKKPADVFGTPDPTKQLGRDAKSGVESQIADISKSVGNVNQRLADERSIRESGITRRAEEQRQKMARMFGIDSGGLKGGRAIRVAGTIGAQEMQGKEQLAGEFGQRVPQEQAQSLQLLQGLQRGQEQADISAATAASQIDLSERAQAFNEYASQRQMTDAEYNSEVNRRVQSGELDIADRDQLLRRRAQVEAETQGAFGRGLSQQAQDFSESIGLRQMSDTEANSAVQRAVANGSITRDDADQLLRERQQTEVERAARFNEGLSQQAQNFSESIGLRQMTEQEATGEVNRAVANGTITRDDADQLLRARAQLESERAGDVQRQTALRSMSDQEANSAMQRAEAAGNQTGVFTDPQTGQTRETLQAELGRRQAAVAERGMSVQEASLSEDTRLRDFALNLQDRIQSGQLTEAQAQTQLQTRQVRVQELQQIQQAAAEKSRLAMEQTRTDIANVGAALDRAIAQGQATGEFIDPKTDETRETLQAKAQTHQQELQNKQFDESVRVATEGFRIQDKDVDNRLTDIENRNNIAVSELNQRKTEFTRTAMQRDDEFKNLHKIGGDEFEELKRRAKAGELDTTKRTDLAYKQFDDMKIAREAKFVSDVAFRDSEAAFQKDVQRAAINGEFEGKTTTQEAQRMWSNAAEEAKLYGDDPPRVMSEDGLRQAFAEYDSTYDFDKNGVVDFTDMIAMGTMGKALGGGNYLVTPEGRSTLATKQMLINSSQFKDELGVKLQGVTNDEERVKIQQQLANDRMTQFRDEIDLRKDDLQRMRDEFATSQTGIVSRVDENGNLVPQYIHGPSTQNPDGSWTPGPWQPATTMSKANSDQAVERFNRDFNIQAVGIAERVGIIPKDNDVAVERFWGEVFEGNDTVIGSIELKDLMATKLGIGRDMSNQKLRENFDEYAKKLYQDENGSLPNPQQLKVQLGRLAKEFLLGSINEEQQGAIASTMAQVTFGAQYSPPPAAPSKAMQWGQIGASLLGSGMQALASRGTTTSDINVKTDIFPLSVTSDIAVKDDITNIATGDDLMEKLDAMPVSTWRYKDEPPNIRHLGPMAQHFKKAFNLGNSDKKIDVVDGMGVALTASKHLNGKVKALNERLKNLERLARGKR
jgi:hypothetical protein